MKPAEAAGGGSASLWAALVFTGASSLVCGRCPCLRQWVGLGVPSHLNQPKNL